MRNIDAPAKSKFQLLDFYIESFDFRRGEKLVDMEIKVDFFKDINFENDKNIMVKFGISVVDVNGQLELNILTIGRFDFVSDDENLTFKKAIIEENTLSILFPFIRSQVTLLTSQPGLEPFILPVLNITNLVKELNSQQ